MLGTTSQAQLRREVWSVEGMLQSGQLLVANCKLPRQFRPLLAHWIHWSCRQAPGSICTKNMQYSCWSLQKTFPPNAGVVRDERWESCEIASIQIVLGTSLGPPGPGRKRGGRHCVTRMQPTQPARLTQQHPTIIMLSLAPRLNSVRRTVDHKAFAALATSTVANECP